MTGREVLKNALDGTRKTLGWFVQDFTDAELFVRPVPAANHVAWQIGNVISGDFFFVRTEFPSAPMPELPEGFLELHGPKGTSNDGPDGFLTKDQYLKLLEEVRTATIAALMALTDEDLDRPSSEGMRPFAPTIGSVFQLASDHTLMHAGQFSVIRRKLGKPVLM
jgi:hypothetical protein